MATVTNSNTLDVTVVDAGNYETTFKLDNPKDSITTLTQVRNAFQAAFTGGWWISRYGYAMTNVIRVAKTVTTKTQFDADS